MQSLARDALDAAVASLPAALVPAEVLTAFRTRDPHRDNLVDDLYDWLTGLDVRGERAMLFTSCVWTVLEMSNSMHPSDHTTSRAAAAAE